MTTEQLKTEKIAVEFRNAEELTRVMDMIGYKQKPPLCFPLFMRFNKGDYCNYCPLDEKYFYEDQGYTIIRASDIFHEKWYIKGCPELNQWVKDNNLSDILNMSGNFPGYYYLRGNSLMEWIYSCDKMDDYILITFHDFEKHFCQKISGYKCIKAYPRIKIDDTVMNSGENFAELWPEYWVPIYEELKIGEYELEFKPGQVKVGCTWYTSTDVLRLKKIMNYPHFTEIKFGNIVITEHMVDKMLNNI